MLTSLTLVRYRCYEHHEFSFRPNTVMVGANNAGKSTAIEALRLVSLVTARYRGFTWSNPPEWVQDHVTRGTKGARPSLLNIGFDHPKTVMHRYQEPPATIRAAFSTGESVEILVGPPATDNQDDAQAQIFAIVRDRSGRPIRDRTEASRLNLPHVAILPQPGPLQRNELPLSPDYVKSRLETDLASRHFRNQIIIDRDTFPHFKELAEGTWPELQITEIIAGSIVDKTPHELMIRDGDFVAEVGAMGHGLQMWLQTMWFLARQRNAACVILDEPDVYMHPDLQRRLIRFVKRRHNQVVIATHSVEMMAEASTGDVLVVNRRSRRSYYADADPDVQRAIEAVGGVHNLHLARLFNSRRVLLVEGKDLSMLRPLYDLIVRSTDAPLDDIPNMPVDGWSGWPLAVGSGLFLRNAVGENIIAYALFDSDYHLPAEIEDRYKQAKVRNVQVHVWRRKEIENYLIEPTAIVRLIRKRVAEDRAQPTIAAVSRMLDQLADDLRNDLVEHFAESVRLQNKQWNVGKCMDRARTILGGQLSSTKGVLHRVCGKDILSHVSKWSGEQYGVTFGAEALASVMQEEELDVEIRDVLRAIARGEVFSDKLCRGWWTAA